MTNIFDYPFSDNAIFTKRKSLKRNLLAQVQNLKERRQIKIAVLGGSTTKDVIQVLELFLLCSGVIPEFYESDFNRYAEEVLFDSEKLWAFKPDIIYIHTTVRNLNFTIPAEDTYRDFEKIWRTIKDQSSALILQNNFENPEVRTFGNLEGTQVDGKIRLVNQLNYLFGQFSLNVDGFYINDINYLSSFIGARSWFDSSFWANFKFPYSSEATLYVAKSAQNIIRAIQGKSKKCLALDLDNTLWGGVIGDDGVEGILLGEGHPMGEAYLNFQRYVKELKNRGIVLAVCSKNDTRLAEKGFSHPDSVLKLEDFSSFYANWDMKSENIQKIAKDLNIGLDSIVFIDDNPAERELVRSQLPMVAVPEVGDNVAEFSRYIDMNGYFESLKILAEDIAKFAYYAENRIRKETEAGFQNYQEFLQSLQMTAEIKPFSKLHLDRITQLINKTNQFNLTTLRMDQNQVDDRIQDTLTISLYARLKDKFGDNGLVSVISGRIVNQEVDIDVWVMSCRVFKRDLEWAVFDSFVEACRAKDIKAIKGSYFMSEKNEIVSDLYKKLGFKKVSDTEWVLEDIGVYEKRNKVIEVVEPTGSVG